MSNLTEAPGLAAFDRTTARWGRLTMIIVLVLTVGGPLYLALFGGLNISTGELLVAFLAVASAYGVFWFVEPITYYPVLGQAGMYQAFLIGNISNKLLPAAIGAQSHPRVNVMPGTRKGELAATMAICGAVVVHITSLLLFVGILGTWIVSVVPTPIVDVAKLYILPAILGAVMVQISMSLRKPRITIIAVAAAVFVTFGLLLVLPVLSPAGTFIVVVITVVLAWILRGRTEESASDIEGNRL
ncbi:hypothetical protein LWF01_18385 [Saxibacter everestensis]|uniref:Uncharacterized protein n=1 Tax=Saxibacter everestensis TaxID=2909229 RepID=A0ABY8QUG6_9MICO|nr:hypothetical protein LWF01_18385 [Brevibacteriaceae bacterium ZFBP1038]